ncbi:MAG: hypothetical protein R6U67_13400 [Sodalinema sp.]|uniref:hypothetical protein n=1 Tax=Sodalinema sp. TaxID=3080550 RepID=UPI00396F48F6
MNNQNHGVLLSELLTSPRFKGELFLVPTKDTSPSPPSPEETLRLIESVCGLRLAVSENIGTATCDHVLMYSWSNTGVMSTNQDRVKDNPIRLQYSIQGEIRKTSIEWVKHVDFFAFAEDWWEQEWEVVIFSGLVTIKDSYTCPTSGMVLLPPEVSQHLSDIEQVLRQRNKKNSVPLSLEEIESILGGSMSESTAHTLRNALDGRKKL